MAQIRPPANLGNQLLAGGPGQLGIHGTNDPATLGTAVSSGCIRMSNDDISFLVESIGLPVGVPVEVRA